MYIFIFKGMIVLKIFGDIVAERSNLLKLFKERHYKKLVLFKGEYVLVFEEDEDVAIISSRYGIC